MSNVSTLGRILILSLAALSFIGCTTFSSPPQPGQERDDGLVVKRLDRLIQKEMKKNSIKGLSVALVDDQDLVWAEGYGFADEKKGIRATPRTLYRAGSISKTMTATAIMSLAEKGRIDLAASITTYLPEFSVKSRFEGSLPITIKQILSHHSGLPKDLLWDFESENPPSLGEIIDRLATQYVCYPPETRFQYSNIAYAALGGVIERLSAKPFETFMEEEILSPLEMNDSRFRLTPEIEEHLSKGYYKLKDIQEVDQTPIGCGPAASLISNVLDMSKFLRCLLANGRIENGHLLNGETIKTMFEVAYPGNELDSLKYGLGWMIDVFKLPNVERSVCHGGDVQGFVGVIAFLPEEKLGVVTLANTNTAMWSAWRISSAALNLLLEAKNRNPGKREKDKEASVAAEREKYEEIFGRYAGPDRIVDVFWKGKKLKTKIEGIEATLIPVGGTRFKVVKEILFLKIDIAKFMGLDGFFIDFRKSREGQWHAVPVFRIGDSEAGYMMFDKVLPSQVPDIFRTYLGTYLLSEESRKHVVYLFPERFQLKLADDWLTGFYKGPILSGKVVLKPASDTQAVVCGSGDTVVIQDGKLSFMGLLYEKSESLKRVGW